MAGYWSRCRYCLICLEGRPISRKIGFFIQMDRVIKFLVGASQARKWERRFALSARKRSCATIKDSRSCFNMLEAKVTKHWQMKYSADLKWFLHPLSQQMHAKPVVTHHQIQHLFLLLLLYQNNKRRTLGSNAVGHCSAIRLRMKQQGLNWYGLWKWLVLTTVTLPVTT